MIMRGWIMLLAAGMMHCTSPLEGPLVADHKYTFVYLGGKVNEDFEDYLLQEPLPSNEPFQYQFPGTSRTFEVYQLSEDGSLPEVLAGYGNAPSFSAILRYHYENPEEMERIQNWIANNQETCRDFFVVSYPGVTPDERSKLTDAGRIFAALPRVRSITLRVDPETGKGYGLRDLFQIYAEQQPRHEPPPPAAVTYFYSFVYVGGSLKEDLHLLEPTTSGKVAETTSRVILADGSSRLIRVGLIEVGFDENVLTMGAIVRVDENSDVSRIAAWVRMNVNRYREVLVIVSEDLLKSSPSIALVADELRAEYPPTKVKVEAIGNGPNAMHEFIERIRHRVPHQKIISRG